MSDNLHPYFKLLEASRVYLLSPGARDSAELKNPDAEKSGEPGNDRPNSNPPESRDKIRAFAGYSVWLN